VPKLTIRNGDTLYREIELDDRELRFGRGEQNDVVLTDATKSVSRRHADLRRENDAYVLFDANSQNGIWAGGRRQQRIVLEPGVPVTVGVYTFQLSDSSAADAAGPPTALANTSETFAGTGVRRSVPAPLPPPSGPLPGRAPGRRISKAMLFAACAVLLLVIMMVSRFMVRPGKPSENPGPPPIIESNTPAPPQPEEIARDQHVASARDALARGDYDSALEEIDTALSAVPDDRESLELKTTIVEAKKAADTAAASVAPGSGAVSGAPPVTGSQAGTTAAVPTAGQGGQRGRGTPPGPAPPAPRAAIPCGPSETPSDCNVRELRLVGRYTVAKSALDAGAFQTAFTQLSEIARDEPAFRKSDIDILLDRARAGLKGMVQQDITAAGAVEAGNDLEAARTLYERAAQIAALVDSTLAADAETHVKRLGARMKEIGSADFTRARQYDAVGRVRDAEPLYDRASRYLPDEDPNKKTAKDRLDALRGRQ
jgi:hypothetical protein